MRKIAVDTVEKRYQKCVKAFETKDITDFGPLCRILDEGISVWGEMLYLKGETLDEYKARKGATDLDRYMCHTYAFVDRNGDWIGSGDMGWFGISSNDKDERAWNDEIQKLMNEAKDDDFLANRRLPYLIFEEDPETRVAIAPRLPGLRIMNGRKAI